MGGFYQPRDGWYIYYIQGWHSEFLFRVPRRQTVADFPEVVRQITVRASEKDVPPKVRRAAAVLEQNQPSSQLTPERFLVLLHEETLNEYRMSKESLYEYALSTDQAFAERWARIGRFWINILFECAYFAGLGLFTLWPWLRGHRSAWSWGVHLGSLPALLLLPYYCGYASWTFTSTGPSGGVFYPWVISWLRRFPVWTSADQWVLEKFPKVLEPLSQSLGSWLVSSGGHSIGPVTAVALGALVALFVCVGIKWATRKKTLMTAPSHRT